MPLQIPLSLARPLPIIRRVCSRRRWGAFIQAGSPIMMPRSLLSKTFAVSLLLHAGLVGLLALEASRRPLFPATPLRVRILEPPTPQAALPPVEASPRAGRAPVEVPRPGSQAARPQPPTVTERLAPRPIPTPDRPLLPEKPATPPPPPQVAAPALPGPVAPRIERAPELPREMPAPTAPAPTDPERRGLILGGPPPAAPSLPGGRGSAPPAGPARPSLREQIAGLGSGLTGDLGGSAKRTVSLDSREEQFVDYLGRLKRRVQRVWDYPEEAIRHGISGELLMVFTLNEAGSLAYIRLVQSSGYPILDEEALRAVKLAAPFEPFPPEMGQEALNIRATFHYDLPRRFRRN
jgi:protein TonB